MSAKLFFAKSFCILLLLSLPALAKDDDHGHQGKGVIGAVYSMNNDATANSLLVFDRMADGSISQRASIATGGKGSGAPLASQSSIAITEDGRFLLAANAGSNEVSVFFLHHGQATLAGHYGSGGSFPYSIAVHHNLVYVLNAGISGGADSTITGFRLGWNGSLAAIPGATYGLSAHFVDPAQVGFDPDGDTLVVTEHGTTTVDVFPVKRDGTLGTLVTNASAGSWPYGFAFGIRNELFVSEAAAMAANASTMSSYRVHENDGSLTTISGAVPTHQTAACWTVVTPGGRFVYTTDALSKSISGFSIDHTGAISLLNSNGITATSNIGFTVDLALSNDGRYLYAISILGSGINAYRVQHDGSLTPVQGLPLTGILAGLVAQ